MNSSIERLPIVVMIAVLIGLLFLNFMFGASAVVYAAFVPVAIWFVVLARRGPA